MIDVQVNQVLTCYKIELEREIRLTTTNTINKLSTLIKEMNEICGVRVEVEQGNCLQRTAVSIFHLTNTNC